MASAIPLVNLHGNWEKHLNCCGFQEDCEQGMEEESHVSRSVRGAQLEKLNNNI